MQFNIYNLKFTMEQSDMSLNLFNTLTRKKEEFVPLQKGKVGIYTCGPTVYDYAHIGNFRSYIFADILRRVLEYNNYQVKQVMNITDVGHLTSDADEGEDKILQGARREKKSPEEIAKFYTDDFLKNIEKLNILRPHILCQATEHIPQMLTLIEKLMSKGYAYEITDGIYFDVQKFKRYGQLSGAKLDKQEAGKRIEVNPEKRNPIDFALWKKADPSHLMQWDSPWGRGYPGWHIECSALSMEYLGETFDIHTGGVDHIPIHHENEIAQSEASTDKKFVNYWMHGEFLQVDGGKMSKSLNNFYKISGLEAKGITPLAFRYFCLSGHYRSPLNFTWESAQGAEAALNNLRHGIRLLAGEESKKIAPNFIEKMDRQFLSAINDDLNMPEALAVVWEVVRRGQNKGTALLNLIKKFDQVLGLRLETEVNPPQIEKLRREREEARRKKDWKRADALRAEAESRGYKLVDTPQGTVAWKNHE